MSNYEFATQHLAQRMPFNSPELREQAFATLKNEGLTITETIKAFRQVAQVSLGEAKQVVSSSLAWQSTALQAKPLQDEAMGVLCEAQS